MVSVTFVMVSVTFFVVSVAGFLVDSATAGGSRILERIERFLVLCVFRIVFVLGFLMVSVTFCYGFRRWFCMVSVAGFWVDSAAAGRSKILELIERFLVFCVFSIGFRRWLFYGFRRGRKTCFYGFRRWLFYGFRRGK